MRMIKTLVCLLFLSSSLLAQSTNEPSNIIITSSSRLYKFVKGNSLNPVQVKEEIRKTYSCRQYRADAGVVEFYDDAVKIDEVNILVNGSKRHGIKPSYEYYNVDGIFYSDAHVCFFKLPLTKAGSTSEVVFKKTILDPHYFTRIYFTDEASIEKQEVEISVPGWMEMELREYNFENYKIEKSVKQSGDETIYRYVMENIPAINRESNAPGAGYIVPHLLVLCKSAQPANERYVYFKTIEDQYAWYHRLVKDAGGQDEIVSLKTREIVRGISDEEEKVKAVYQWVQQNIRYIAFENGIAGFKPEKAGEVLRKKYGDCKGMANLLTVMLQSLNLDARRCWIGTKQIPYDYTTPSLAVDNHMICAWMKDGKPVFLDATEKYIGFGEIAERIQNRQTLIENGDSHLLHRVPAISYDQNTALEKRILSLEGKDLKGTVKQTWNGENKGWLLHVLHDMKQDKQENIFKEYLAIGGQNFEISDLKTTNIDNHHFPLEAEYKVVLKNAISDFGGEIYLNPDNRRSYDNRKIDTTKRKLPYWFGFKDHSVMEVEIQLPKNMAVISLPTDLSIKKDAYSFIGSYKTEPGKIIYRREIILSDTELQPQDFSKWNADISQLSTFYNQQIILTTAK